VAKNLQTWLNTSLPENQRAAAAKAAFFGPHSNPTNEDLMLDGISADTSKMQAAATGPLESWWPGGGGPMLVIQGRSDVVAPHGGIGPGVGGTVRGAVSGGLSGVPPRVAQPQPSVRVRRHCTTAYCNSRVRHHQR
jgi:hypothetical protein